jgi:heme-degrading monooxygenase HmoA
MSDNFSPLFTPPYYAVIFAAQLSDDIQGYGETATQMVALAQAQPGFLGVESTRGEDGFGITVSYWKDEASILGWKQQMDHQNARRQGRERWYTSYTLRVSRVERNYEFPKND